MPHLKVAAIAHLLLVVAMGRHGSIVAGLIFF